VTIWAGNPLQYTITKKKEKKNPRIFQSSGRSPGTIRPLAKPFSHFILYQAGRLEQLDHLKKKKQKAKKSIKKKREEKRGKEEGLSQLFVFTKLTIKSQKKINFLMHLHRKHCKEGATVITQFWPFGF
jgi:hypothetical protein